ncbi:bifunctional methylenetetrahydrofolate dehydrogenase/methenyltetrahydrofolate cyclohydrolase FolD [Desulfohalobium retbaense]|uniref:Bifunctional protein FolD n=1 Tax=Desulfohalobium retbaense (strain ATCC 49708 / DSM 5692 / JCM 16813 / HR100) TaxID=485915 RepID=C8WZP5_DESRD|nr:bifunctional methylenetetrahydrofolate dehydrogenase/methenyltetrahydrofolate cyclohydrolase FolD [Desulfohalobium retbaense]ACV67520.1 Methylenetetrahydrofolate dehydrogenase (NADP(+)) [Desulfohalobium retbaense DSM 5692]
MLLLNGKETAATIRARLKTEIAGLVEAHGRPPGLAVILVGEDAPSQVYVRNKERACADAGIASQTFRLPADTPQAELEGHIQDLNAREDIDGILLQLPLPTGLDSQRCLDLIDPAKDVDGFHPVNMGRLLLNLPGPKPCTPAGILTLLDHYGIDPAGKHCVIVGRSNIVGKPLAQLLLARHGTVTVCHSRTRDLPAITRQGDIVCVAIGRTGFLTPEMVKEGAVVVDVGINRTDDGLKGDADFDGLQDKVAAITPVPGGVGPMTIAQLLLNTLESYTARVQR